jgi:hypothetical protein
VTSPSPSLTKTIGKENLLGCGKEAKIFSNYNNQRGQLPTQHYGMKMRSKKSCYRLRICAGCVGINFFRRISFALIKLHVSFTKKSCFSTKKPVLGIRDILVRIRICTIRHLWQTDLDSDTDPTLDPTAFFSDLEDTKKYFFHIFFL